MRKLCFLLIVISLLISRNASAFDNKTHPRLTDEAIESSKLKVILTDSLNCPDGAETSVNGLTIRNWLKRGSTLEDVPMCRASNHFHNPRRGWDVSGMRDQPWFVDWHCSESEYPPGNIKSNVHWATGYTAPPPGGSKDPIGNQWDWDHAREFYYIYLTGKDSQGNPVASTEDEREIYFAKCFQALGQVLHLLQDMAVPAHVRDDFKSHLDFQGITVDNLFSPAQWFGDNFEYYVGENIEEWLTGGSQIEFTEPSITEFWDTDKYSGQDPDLLISQMIGLAEYTNMNFASKDTVFAEDFLNDSASYNDVYYHPYPRKSSTNVQELLDENLLPKTVISEDGKVDTGFWIEKTGDGVAIDHFVKPTYFTLEIKDEPDYDERLFFKTFKIDYVCAKDYAEHLLPRAVGYSAGLLDYFFRGKIQVISLPIFLDNNIYALQLKIKNITPTGGAMTGGHFSLVCRYTPTGGNPDGSDDIFVRAPDVNCDVLQYGGEIEILSYLPERIPIENYESVKCILAFQGTLGNEVGAVIGKYFTLGEIRFSEEWDNGLTGNHPWIHNKTEDESYGTGSNTIDNDILIKDNIRYVGYKEPRVNESFIDFDPDAMLITPNTYLQFKIDDLSINEIPPAPLGTTTNLHALELHFNNELHLQLSQEGQFMYYNPPTAYYSFTLGSIIVSNIYSLFENADIQIPEPLYLEYINFIQQLLDLQEPSTVEHHQHMEVDFICIIEAKQIE